MISYDNSMLEQMFSDFIGGISGMMLLDIPLLLLRVASSLVLGFCVYYHARLQGSRKAVMWGVLSGFFAIAALIYLIIQLASKPKVVYCFHCGCPLATFMAACPHCGAPQIPTSDALDEQTAALCKKRFRVLLIVWIVLYVLQTVLSVFCAIAYVQLVKDLFSQIMLVFD